MLTNSACHNDFHNDLQWLSVTFVIELYTILWDQLKK